MPPVNKSVWVPDLGIFVRINSRTITSSQLNAEANCPALNCKYLAIVKSKKSENAAIRAIRGKLEQHASRCPKK